MKVTLSDHAQERLETVAAAQAEAPRIKRSVDEALGSGFAPNVDAALATTFRAVVFDWDGTAVVDRREDTAAFVCIAEALLRLGVWLVVITGTNFGNIDRQFCARVAPRLRPRLLVCANRGSEVYGFDRSGAVKKWDTRTATPEEEQALTAIADGVRAEIEARTGLTVAVVYDRLNRRKIDLIPLPEWADPPKSQIAALRVAVEDRLREAGWQGGIGAVIALTQRLAREHGLSDARITSDVKHVEVGLTDKGDSARWVLRHLLRSRRIPLHDVLVGGDEFGAISDFPGSDDRLLDGMDGATIVSVGPEPGGVPAGVIHLGAGPARFRALLADQVWRHTRAHRPVQPGAGAWPALERDPAWRLEAEGYFPPLERDVESRFTIANGLLGVRGSMEQSATGSQPRTFVAGLFERADTEPSLPALVPAPDWLRLRVIADGIPLSVEASETSYARQLDLRRGMLHTTQYLRAGDAMVRLDAVRFVSLVHRELAVQTVAITVDRPIALRVEALAGSPERGLTRVSTTGPATVWSTDHGRHGLTLASAAEASVDATPLSPRTTAAEGDIGWDLVALPDRPLHVLRLTTFVRGDAGVGGTDHAVGRLRVARRAGLARLVATHSRAWTARWAEADIEIEGDETTQRALRFALFHLIGAANPDDTHVSIGARGLTGDAYLGHVFWDTEIFLLPFYTSTWPEAARALLLYRYRTLDAARAKATALGYQGALYAWESADTGEETTPPYAIGPDGRVIPILCGTEEQHISADVAYATWQYWQTTADHRFLLDAGAEILLETARFWASRVVLEQDGRYHIRRVIGPDEYHESIDDNAFTNALAGWNLERGIEVATLLARRWPDRWASLRDRIGLTPTELHHWRDAIRGITAGHRSADGVIEQFAGFFALEPVDLATLTPRTAPVDVLLGRERTQRSQVIKQADVVLLLSLLWDRFAPEVRTANFHYYEPRCAQGSSLSPAVHALIAARLGETELAHRYLSEAAAIDLDDSMGNAAQGLHMATLGGLWQAIVRGFAGFSPGTNSVTFQPCLPAGWQAVRFPLRWRGRILHIELCGQPPTLAVTLVRGRPLAVSVGAHRTRLAPGVQWRWSPGPTVTAGEATV